MKYGFLGCGNMGGAMAAAAAKAVGGGEILAADHHAENTERLRRDFGAVPGTALQAAETCAFLFLGVKPQAMEQLFAEIGPTLRARRDRVILVSMAAGLTIEGVRRLAGRDLPVIRIMPNTPAAVGEGMILFAADGTTEEEKAEFLRLLSCAGRTDELPEKLIDAGSAVAGCGPAFACLFLEALADGGVECGLPRKKAQLYAAQMLLGTAKLALEGQPAALKDAVCSPGGTTIAGVHALEAAGFRAAAMDAVTAAYEKTEKLRK